MIWSHTHTHSPSFAVCISYICCINLCVCADLYWVRVGVQHNSLGFSKSWQWWHRQSCTLTNSNHIAIIWNRGKSFAFLLSSCLGCTLIKIYYYINTYTIFDCSFQNHHFSYECAVHERKYVSFVFVKFFLQLQFHSKKHIHLYFFSRIACGIETALSGEHRTK